jgi:predicted metalloprotease with PDZ domain
VLAGSPAAQAGVHPGDQLVALDGLRVTAAGWASTLAQLEPERARRLHVFRDDELHALSLVPAAPLLDTWTVTLADVSGATLARRNAWLSPSPELHVPSPGRR